MPPKRHVRKQVMNQSERTTRSGTNQNPPNNTEENQEGESEGEEYEEEKQESRNSGGVLSISPTVYNYISNDSAPSPNYPALPNLRSSSTVKFGEWKKKVLSVFGRSQVKDAVTMNTKDYLTFIFLNAGTGNTPFKLLKDHLTQQAKLHEMLHSATQEVVEASGSPLSSPSLISSLLPAAGAELDRVIRSDWLITCRAGGFRLGGMNEEFNINETRSRGETRRGDREREAQRFEEWGGK